MRKHKYNQGDLIQFQRTVGIGPFTPHLLVITKVFTTGRGKYADNYYTFTWVEDGSKNTYQINTLDDDLNFKLVARGQ